MSVPFLLLPMNVDVASSRNWGFHLHDFCQTQSRSADLGSRWYLVSICIIIASWMSFTDLCIVIIQQQWQDTIHGYLLKTYFVSNYSIYLGFRVRQSLMRLCPCKISKGTRDRVTLTWHFSQSFQFFHLEKEQKVHRSLFVISFLIELQMDSLHIALHFKLCPKVLVPSFAKCFSSHSLTILFFLLSYTSFHQWLDVQSSPSIKTCFLETTWYMCVNLYHCQHILRDS